MTEKYTLDLDETPNSDDLQIIRDGLTAFNLQFVPDAQHKLLNIFLRASDGAVTGGLVGRTYWGWLYVSLFWLDESVCGRGFGKKMLHMAEEEALRRGCTRAHLDTLDFQALQFYEKQGYCVFGTLEDLPHGHKRHFLQKVLVDANA
jgi:GNAT superfamily N-acetyltransferase